MKKAASKSEANRKAPEGRILELTYDVAELPSSQHRAGLAGLVLMCRWLAERVPHERRGTCELVDIDARRATVRFDRDGLASLLDQVYGADSEERAYPQPFKGKPPVREETRTEPSAKTGKPVTKTMYFYPVVVPKGAYLGEDWENGRTGPWLKLWRDMVWTILRGVPATRAPFEARANREDAGDADDLWTELCRNDATVELPSTYFLGAQAKTAENVRFRDLARNQFLLHFWPFIVQIYVPAELDAEGKRSFPGYALAIPDIAELDTFCDELPRAMRQRSAELTAYLPRQAVVDLAIESALDFMARLVARLETRQQHWLEGLLYGVDVFHLQKEGNNIRILGTARVHPRRKQVDAYITLRDVYRAGIFRRQRLLNLVEDRPHWYHGFDRIVATVPMALTLESSWFRTDARTAFDKEGYEMTQQDSTQSSLEILIYRLVGRYIGEKLESKHQIVWKEVKGDESRQQDYSEKREKIAKDAFLAIRSRTGTDFVDYFVGTICSGFERLNEQDYATVAAALIDEAQIQNVRILTLLALSARA